MRVSSLAQATTNSSRTVNRPRNRQWNAQPCFTNYRSESRQRSQLECEMCIAPCLKRRNV